MRYGEQPFRLSEIERAGGVWVTLSRQAATGGKPIDHIHYSIGKQGDKRKCVTGYGKKSLEWGHGGDFQES